MTNQIEELRNAIHALTHHSRTTLTPKQIKLLDEAARRELARMEAGRDGLDQQGNGAAEAVNESHQRVNAGSIPPVCATLGQPVEYTDGELSREIEERPLSAPIELQRFGVTWKGGGNEFLLTPMPDGYWTPWHLADAKIRFLRSVLLAATPSLVVE